ncbi:acetyl-CoA carboxylase [Culex quinquefasciatus]|uniref:Acetyl-CoA carboxylase n=1 Tax=Culex quinquefasciatus TaxID=7176 RepID=B0WPW4_CULQU|nr:acetyl-CoA carboxylase [Culex quinquefasciatus]|eukprot:XP_001850748.1 acetyl-CoA carboxylase [Culex quinquefasciatus]
MLSSLFYGTWSSDNDQPSGGERGTEDASRNHGHGLSENLKTNVEYIKIAGTRAYSPYDLTCLQHLELSGKVSLTNFQFLLPTAIHSTAHSSQTASSLQPKRLVHGPGSLAAFDSYEHFTQYSDEILDLLGDITSRRSLTRRCWRWFNRSLTPDPSLFSPEYIVIDGRDHTYLYRMTIPCQLDRY